MIAGTLDVDSAARRSWDVVVIGAGPAGALAARQVAAGGSRVLLVDRKAFPRPKVCGACLNGKALAVLDSVGLGDLVDRLGGSHLRRFEVRLAGRAATFPLPAGKALARDVLDGALVAEAIAAGADFLPATTATVEGGEPMRTIRLDGHGQGVAIEARVVVVASGLGGSSLADERDRHTERDSHPQRPASAPNGQTTQHQTPHTFVAPHSRIGAGCSVSTYPSAYTSGAIYMALGRSGYVGLVRVAGDVLNVAAAFDRTFVRNSGGPAAAAATVLDEAGFEPVPAFADAGWHGTVSLTRHTRPVAGHRMFLIGDAAGYVEPFTGEGMGTALLSAKAVAPLVLRAANAWEPALAREWVRLHHRLVGRQEYICRALAAASRQPWLARIVFGLAVRSPAFSGGLIRRVNQSPAFIEVLS